MINEIDYENPRNASLASLCDDLDGLGKFEVNEFIAHLIERLKSCVCVCVCVNRNKYEIRDLDPICN